MDKQLSDLLAKQAITEAIYRYCRGFDRFDSELVRSTWHPGGRADYGAHLYQGTGDGFVAWCWPQHEASTALAHQVLNILISVDGERAASEAYVRGVLRYRREDTGTVEIVNYGRYVDEWSFKNGRWALEFRRYVQDFCDERTIAKEPLPSFGRRGRDDPSYHTTPAL